MRFATGLNPNVIVAEAAVDGFGDLTVLQYVAAPEEGKPLDARAPRRRTSAATRISPTA